MNQAKKPPKRRRPWGRLVFLFISACVVVVVAAAPWLIANTPLRNIMFGKLFSDSGLQASAGGLSCGWFSPLQVTFMAITHPDDTLRTNVDRLAFEKSWLQIWLGKPSLGGIAIERPEIDLVMEKIAVAEPGSGTESGTGSGKPSAPIKWTMQASVRSASVRVRTPQEVEPVIALEGFDMDARIIPNGPGRLLILDPFTVFADKEVTSELCNHGLQLVAPVLADSVQVDGQVSLEITEFVVPLDEYDADKQAELLRVAGELRLNHVNTGLKNPLMQELAGVASQLLGVQVPQTLQIADDTNVRFAVRDGRVYHEGLVFLLPEISSDFQWRTSGSVGLDESLDLTVQARLPFTMIHDGPLTRKLSERPIEFGITGTIHEPVVELFQEDNWIDGLLDLVATEDGAGDEEGSAESLATSILDVLGRAVEGIREETAERGTPLLDRMRERRRSRREAPPGDQEQAEEDRRGVLPRGLFRRRDRSTSDEP